MKAKTNFFLYAVMSVCTVLAAGCGKIDEMDADLDGLKLRIEALEKVAAEVNGNAVALKKLFDSRTTIVGMTNTDNGYVLELSDGTEVSIVAGTSENSVVPVIGVDADGNWIVSLDGGMTFEPVGEAENIHHTDGMTPNLKVDADGYWLISVDGVNWNPLTDNQERPVSAVNGGQFVCGVSFFEDVRLEESRGIVVFTLLDGSKLEVAYCADFDFRFLSLPDKPKIFLGQTLSFGVSAKGVSDAMFRLPSGWEAKLSDSKISVTAPLSGTEGEYVISVIAVSDKGFLKVRELVLTLVPEAIDPNNSKVWNDFVAGNAENVLLDYSYAGYAHGESAPAPAEALGYKLYDVTDYGAVPNDGKSDREAFLKCLEDALGTGYVMSDKTITFNHKESANAIVYFPEGEFILHTSEDDVTGKDGKRYSRTIQIRSGNFVLKGAGRGRTVLLMQDACLPVSEEVMYSSPVMLELKHNSGLSVLTDVTGPAVKGSFSVEVSSVAGLSAGDWVSLVVKNNDPVFVAEELHPYKPSNTMTDIVENGVKVTDYHQIKSVNGHTVTFVEPIMRAVDPKWGWTIQKYPHYENVGVEDLTFKGNATDHFVHHASWEDDGAYKPLNMTRLVNSWMRRVGFVSVSEACSVVNCANVSVYDILLEGRRGHAAVRSAGSSRVFIGATVDMTGGDMVDQSSVYMENAGQYHAVGVSKQSMGAVLWRNVWGNDSCFESHASQPRATLIDCCRGGWMRWRQGGDKTQVPNHLADLTLWNFTSTTPYTEGPFIWWDHNSFWWKFVMPVSVGFNGEACEFDAGQMTLDSSHGIPVNPESLYEAQLAKRLGAVPSWLLELKNN